MIGKCTGRRQRVTVRFIDTDPIACMLSKMMLSGANVLLMDEPTNHLDLESITALNDGLIAFKSLMHRRNMRIISRMAEGAYDEDDDDEYDEYDEDDEDDEDYDDEDDEDDGEEGTGFLTSISNLLKSREAEASGEEEEEDEEDEEDEYEKPDGPKFRVVKK